jgi:hypothetical protein
MSRSAMPTTSASIADMRAFWHGQALLDGAEQ